MQMKESVSREVGISEIQSFRKMKKDYSFNCREYSWFEWCSIWIWVFKSSVGKWERTEEKYVHEQGVAAAGNAPVFHCGPVRWALPSWSVVLRATAMLPSGGILSSWFPWTLDMLLLNAASIWKLNTTSLNSKGLFLPKLVSNTNVI